MKWTISTLVRRSPLALAIAAAGACLASSGHVTTSGFGIEHGGWTVADFDGDNRPDVAIANPARRNGYELDIQLSTKGEKQIGLPALPASPFGFHLTPLDVDGDHDLDIVVTAGIIRQPVAIWINDGRGGFSEGDLGSYFISSSRENFFLSPESPDYAEQGLWVPARRSWFGSAPRAEALDPVRCTAILARDRSRLLISSATADKRSARAPPALL